MTKPRKTRIQRLEGQLRKTRADLKDLREMALTQGQLSIDHGIRISQLRKKIDSAVRVSEIETASLKNKIFVANTWSKALLKRIYQLEQRGFWKQVGRLLSRKAGKTV